MSGKKIFYRTRFFYNPLVPPPCSLTSAMPGMDRGRFSYEGFCCLLTALRYEIGFNLLRK
ncbi:hypothetical protein KsCSTR_04940 [Candidatus Kuenenia stuttgartiensis]|uniref:Uncharacterized protein n=1 Tax=Kuenenia stuttgartiensis TaxID=174633 RepID=Q1Q092_KUEST|nr:hypothetical protein KsCSTR_04940 [Candidatus Kuenenia stuttgartiensis]CAJ72749.1 unknown protein [Candidatus Kuenenia stuttgartiensis]